MHLSAKSLNHSTYVLANAIMAIILPFRRIIKSLKFCHTHFCNNCVLPHLTQVISAIQKEQPITFVLPAFPLKSPNPQKVLGKLPDMAEYCSLTFLNNLCKKIQQIYLPGAHIIICSDGRVFNDVVGVHEIDVTNYQNEINDMIKKNVFTCISTFDLEDFYSGINSMQMKNRLIEQYGESLNSIKQAIKQGANENSDVEDQEINRQYCGITRFLFEDKLHDDISISRTAIQKIARENAYIVIQRSRALSKLISEVFPHAVRLSIHPQTCGANKLSIGLMESEIWQTPWHGVAVKKLNGNFILMKRKQAEILGARLVYENKLASHYELLDE